MLTEMRGEKYSALGDSCVCKDAILDLEEGPTGKVLVSQAQGPEFGPQTLCEDGRQSGSHL